MVDPDPGKLPLSAIGVTREGPVAQGSRLFHFETNPSERWAGTHPSRLRRRIEAMDVPDASPATPRRPLDGAEAPPPAPRHDGGASMPRAAAQGTPR
jgi:hypothetical protein